MRARMVFDFVFGGILVLSGLPKLIPEFSLGIARFAGAFIVWLIGLGLVVDGFQVYKHLRRAKGRNE